jgi:methyl-accepting chemotaxis protein
MSILKRGIIIVSFIIVFAILITFLISYFIRDKGFLEIGQDIILFIVIGIVFVFGLLIFFAIYRFGTRRLGNLSTELKNIGEEKDFARRINTRGQNELSILSSSINPMLDEMTSGTPYREPLAREDALKRIEAGAGTLYDPELVNKFAGLIDNYIEII